MVLENRLKNHKNKLLNTLDDCNNLLSEKYFDSVETINEIDKLTDITLENFISGKGFEKYKNSERTSIKYCAFMDMENLKEIDLPNVTSISGSGAIKRCRGLETINLPLVETLPLETFRYCSKLTNVNAPLVTTINNYTFSNCLELENLNINSEEFTSIPDQAFQNCYKVKELSLSDKCISIGNYSFQNCYELENLGNLNIITMGNGGFTNCNKLKNIDFSNTTTIGAYGCSYMYETKELIAPLLEKVNNQTFANNTGLSKVDLTACSSIAISAFNRCIKLTRFILRNPSMVTLSNANALYNTPIHTSAYEKGQGYIYVPTDLVDSYKTATNWITYAKKIRAIEDYEYSITNNSEAYSSNINTTIFYKDSYANNIDTLGNSQITSIQVLMGDEDISSSCVQQNDSSTATILIPEVTGNIIINITYNGVAEK